MPEWKTAESYQKLLAAMVAAQEMKLDYRKIATYYGEGATYDSIEGRFRIIKREAKKLKDEIDTGARPAAPPRGQSTSTTSSATTNNSETTPKKPRGGRKAAAGSPTPKKEKVISGRVEKKGTPVKGTKAMAVGYAYSVGNGGFAGGEENVVNGVKQEIVSSGSSVYGGEEDAVGDFDFDGLQLGYEGLQEGI